MSASASPAKVAGAVLLAGGLQFLLMLGGTAAADADGAGAAPPSATTKLITLTDPRAKCMDGTQSGFALPPPSQDGRWQGQVDLHAAGRWRVRDRDELQEEGARAAGSSKYFTPNYTFWRDSSAHFIDASCTGNPVLCDYNLVYLPYCSQDLWSGIQTSARPETFGYTTH